MAYQLVTPQPAMEQFNKYHKQGLQCSFDPFAGDRSIPEGARTYFEREGYMIIKNLYDPKKLYHTVPEESGQIHYWGKRVDEFNHVPEDDQVNGSLVRYMHPQYRKIHSKVRRILEDILGEELYNTYYHDRFCFAGQRLQRHCDRYDVDACEISVSIQCSTNTKNPWPFCIQTPSGGKRAFELEDGWGILYNGRETDHWREPLESCYTRKRDKLKNWITRKEDDTYYHQISFHYGS